MRLQTAIIYTHKAKTCGSGAARAKNYYTFVSANSDLFQNLAPNSYQTFYISDENFRTLVNHKKAEEYLKFFKEKL